MAIKTQAAKFAKGLSNQAMAGGKFIAKPLANPFVGRAQLLKRRVDPIMKQMKTNYQQMFLPKAFKQNQNKGKYGNYRK
jgi:hypothetical protein